jgi:hypothetical protein
MSESKIIIETSKFGIIDLVVKLMTEVESFVDFPGQKKKEYVIDQIQLVIGEEDYEIYGELIDLLVEFIIAISRGQYELNLNNIKKITTKCCTML